MNGRCEVAHVAHVGRSDDHAVRGRGDEVTTNFAAVGDVGGQQRGRIAHVCIRVILPLDVDLASGGLCRAPETLFDALLQGLQRFECVGTYVPVHCRVLGDDVRLVAPVGEDAMHPFGRSDVLSQCRDGVIGENCAVEGVSAHVGSRSGVRLAAVEMGATFMNRNGAHRGDVDVGGVHHHRRVEAPEGSVAGHRDLSTATLFGRRAVNLE